MRSALLSTICVATVCAAAVPATAACQTAPAEFALTSVPAASSAITRPTLLAEATPAPAFSTSDDVSGSATAALPDAPSAAVDALEGQAGVGHAPTGNQPVAPKYSPSILPGQTAIPFSTGDKITFAFRQEVSPFTMLSRVVSATWSQAIDSAPHYGQGWEPYGQRVGAAFARGAVQDLATYAVFDPIFRDDPRYYVLGRQHKLINRAIYAATRIIITRTDSGHNTVNAPLLLGYAAAAGANMAYYPERDRNFHDAATGYAGSLGGGALGMEVSEFLPDVLHMVHLRRD